MRRVLVGIAVAALATRSFAQSSPQRAVLVTGASSGIGRKVTERLAANGFFIYAGARAQKDLDDLNAIKNVQAVKLDVTSATDISAALATVTKAGKGLYGVVNNAEVVVVAPLIELEEKDLDFIFNVNVYGPYRVTKAFAPLLLRIEREGGQYQFAQRHRPVDDAVERTDIDDPPFRFEQEGCERLGDAVRTVHVHVEDEVEVLLLELDERRDDNDPALFTTP